MAAIFQIRRGSGSLSLTDGELYLNKTSQSLQIGTGGGGQSITLAKMNDENIGSFLLTGDIRLSGSIYLGNETADNISALGVFTTNLVPSENSTKDVGTTISYWRNIYATNISGAIAATNGVISGSSQLNSVFEEKASSTHTLVSGSSQIIGILDSLNTFSGSQLTQNTTLATITGSLITSASTAKTTNDAQAISITNLNTFSGSQLTQNSALETITGSLILSASTAKTTNDAQAISITNLNTFSESLSLSASNYTQRIGSIETYTSSLKTAIELTGSSITILGNLVVKGTQTTIDSTTVQLGDNIIELNGSSNTNGGLLVKDPTAASLVSGSLLWDASNDYWKGGALGNESKFLVAEGDSVVSGSSQITLQSTNGFSSFNSALANITGSLINSASSFETRFGAVATISGSLISTASNHEIRVVALESTASYLQGLFSTSVDSRLDNLEAASSSFSSSILNLNGFSASQLTQNTNLASYTSSVSTRLTEIGVVTGSLIISASNAKTTNDAQDILITNLNSVTASLLVETHNLELFSASILTQNVTLAQVTSSLILATASLFWTASDHEQRLDELRYDVDLLTPAGLSAAFDAINQATNSLQLFSASAKISIANLELYTSSANIRLNNLELTSASVNTSISNINTTTASLNTSVSNLNLFSSSALTRLSALETETSNLETTSASVNISVAALNSYTASLKTAITIAGSDVTLNGNLTVAGTTTTINSTTVNIDDNIIQLNGTGATNGGIVVRDATAVTTTSGSLLWDTTNDRWIAGPLGSEAKVLTDGMGVISGSGQLGNYETTGRGIVSGSSQIVPLLPAGTVSGSSQVIGILSSLNSYTQSNDTTNTTQNSRLDQLSTASGSAISRLTALEVETSNLESFTSSINTTIKNQLNANTIVSGSSQISGLSNAQLSNSSITIAGTLVSLGNSITVATILNGTNVISSSAQITATLPSGVVSGSSQIDLTATTNYASGILTRLNAVGVVSGSSQINLGSATGNITLATQTTGDYVASLVQGTGVTITNNSGENATPTIAIGQAIGTSAHPQFHCIGLGTAASGVTGEVRATGDIVAFYSSDERLKSNIQPIGEALSKVNQISGNTYDWKEGFENIHSHIGTDVGVIAQEIEKILPQAVIDRDNGYKAVDYEKIIPLLIEAIKELSAKVDSLENK